MPTSKIGIDQLDAGLGRPLDSDDVIRRGRERLAEAEARIVLAPEAEQDLDDN